MILDLFLLHRVYRKHANTIQVLMGVFASLELAQDASDAFVAQFRKLMNRPDHDPSSFPQIVRFECLQEDTSSSMPLHVYVCAREPKHSYGRLATFCDAYCITPLWSTATAALSNPPRDAVDDDELDANDQDDDDDDDDGDEPAQKQFTSVQQQTLVFLMPLNVFRWRCDPLDCEVDASSVPLSVAQDDVKYLKEWIDSRLCQLEDERERGRQPSKDGEFSADNIDWPSVLPACNVATLCTLKGALEQVSRNNQTHPRPLVETALAAVAADKTFCMEDLQALLVPVRGNMCCARLQAS
jgi:hypothetical protein